MIGTEDGKPNYPKSEFNTGQIIDFSEHPRFENGNVVGHKFYDESEFSAFPHLFRPLAWYEFKDVADMPKYVKVTLDGSDIFYNSVCECETWVIGDTPEVSLCGGYWFEPHEVTPATEAEYIEYQKSKTK